MNVYIVEVAKQLTELGVEVEIFTRATASDLPPAVPLAPGVLVRHVTAGPYEGLSKDDLPAQLCAFAAGVLRAEAQREPGWYDVIHSHYWLSGQVGWLARERWGVPLVHSAHTLAKVKNARLAAGDRPEPWSRMIGEAQVVAESDRLVASTAVEATQLIELYGADSNRVEVIAPGVDLERFRPDSASTARTRLGIPPDAVVLLFVGRIQPLKGPDILLRAVARLAAEQPRLRENLVVCVVGAPSGTGLVEPEGLRKLTGELGIGELVRFLPPTPAAELAGLYAAADLTVVPSYNESFGLVALESQACGTPVLAAAVGGLRTAVADGVSGVLVDGHDPAEYAAMISRLVARPVELARLAAGCRPHAERFSWRRTAERLISTYQGAMADLIFASSPRSAAR